jgi:hypothetical protein
MAPLVWLQPPVGVLLHVKVMIDPSHTSEGPEIADGGIHCAVAFCNTAESRKLQKRMIFLFMIFVLE